MALLRINRAALTAAVLMVGASWAPLAQKAGDQHLDASVIDAQGNSPAGLTSSNFRVKFRGKPVDVVQATVNASPRQVSIVVDTSKSASASWAFAWTSAEHLAAGLTPKNSVAVSSLSTVLQQHSVLSSDPGVLRAALMSGRGGKPGGASALYNGLITASGLFSKAVTGDAICLVTDGDDTASIATPDDARKELLRNHLRLFVVRLGRSTSRSSSVDELRRTAEATGGFMLQLDLRQESADLKKLQSLYPAITQLYQLEVVAPRASGSPADWSLEVVNDAGKKVKDIQARLLNR